MFSLLYPCIVKSTITRNVEFNFFTKLLCARTLEEYFDINELGVEFVTKKIVNNGENR